MVSSLIKICNNCPFLRETQDGSPACGAKLYVHGIDWPATELTDKRKLRPLPGFPRSPWKRKFNTPPDWCPLPVKLYNEPPKIKKTLADLRRHKKRLHSTRNKLDEELTKTNWAIYLQSGGAARDIAQMAQELAEYLEEHSDGVSRSTIYTDLYSNYKCQEIIEKALEILVTEGLAMSQKVPTDGSSREVWYPKTTQEDRED